MNRNGNRITLELPAKAEYIGLSRLALAGLSQLRGVEDETLADLKLALTEACSNSVRHAYEAGRGGTVLVTYELQPGRLAIEVADDGPGFDPGDVGETIASVDDLTESGLGMAIIRALADELEIGGRTDGGGSRLRFVKVLD